MLVQFVTNHENVQMGFSAEIQYVSINSICNDWFNINTRFLISPEHPTMDCSWVIIAPMGSTILIQFHAFEVILSLYTFL